MLEYKNIEALYWVVESGSFEKAGVELCVTQSAVTQRVKQLEENLGQILLLRSHPPKATKSGVILIEHYKKVRQLESELNIKNINLSSTIQLAINADSLATWFKEVIKGYYKSSTGKLELIVADQDSTIELLEKGEVMGCISTYTGKVRGCNSYFLGHMLYRFVCSKSFNKKYFKNGVTLKAIDNAPKINFNKDDNLLNIWLNDKFNTHELKNEIHYIPSSELFSELILEGDVCGICDEYSYKNNIDSFVDLTNNNPIKVPIYFHRWAIKSKELDIVTKLIHSIY